MKIILRFFFFIIFSLILFVVYFSIIGFETSRFNNQIIGKIKSYNQNLDVDLKEIKIVLDPIKLRLNIKTIGSKITNKGKIIEIENLKSQLPISSLFKKKFLIKNLEISTKTLDIKNLISFIRIFHNKPEIYLLEKMVKKGFIVADIELNFDDDGNIKKDLIISGLIKDLKVEIFKKYKIDQANLIFRYKFNTLNIDNINFNFNDLKLKTRNLVLQKNQKIFKVKGEIQNDFTDLNENQIDLFIKPFFPNLKIKKIRLNSKNNFNFKLNEKYRLSNLEINSNITLDEFLFINDFKLNKIFPEATNLVNLKSNKLSLNYKKKSLEIKGSGAVLFQNKEDKISYFVKKNNKDLEFKGSIEIEKNPLQLEILQFEKKLNEKSVINVEGEKKFNKDLIFKNISFKELDNKLKINNLKLNDKFQIIDLKNIEMFYFDKANNINDIKIIDKKNLYSITGSSFNADKIISNLIKNDEVKKDIFKKNFKVEIKIDRLLLDQKHSLNNFKGNLLFKNEKIVDGNIIGNFSKNEKFKFTIKNIGDEKITTLFLDRAKPIVKRYSFIKGFDEGILDFYSSQKNNVSNSTLKIYDFKLKELPALTKLLTLASLQGIADLLSGEGIRFDEFEMNFKNKDNLMTIEEIYAIGPAISILMNGYIEKKKLVSLRGTLVPATTINKVIGSIPILGKILVGSKTGEGVFGVSFKIKGPPNNLETTVNPIKTLTPRFITRTLERLKKN